MSNFYGRGVHVLNEDPIDVSLAGTSQVTSFDGYAVKDDQPFQPLTDRGTIVAGTDNTVLKFLRTTEDGYAIVSLADAILDDKAFVPTSDKALLVAGTDNVNSHILRTTEDGYAIVALNTVAVDQSPFVPASEAVLVAGTDNSKNKILRTTGDGYAIVSLADGILDGHIYQDFMDKAVLIAGVADGYAAKLLRVTPDGRLHVSIAETPTTLEAYFIESVKDAGGGDSLLVNGSATPVEFTLNAHATKNTFLVALKFIASGTTDFGAGKFMNVVALANGVKIEIVSRGIATTLFNLKQNEEFFALGDLDALDQSATDIISIVVPLGSVPLNAGSGDKVRITVRDLLTAAGSYFKCFVRGSRL